MKVLHDLIVVEPLYDSDKIGSIFIPESYSNPEAQQGIVVYAGPHTIYSIGEHLIYHPFRSKEWPANPKLQYIESKDVVAWIANDQMFPVPGEAMIRPNWNSKYEPNQRGQIYLPVAVSDGDQAPVRYGTIEWIGHKPPVWLSPDLKRGDYVVLPSGIGSEAAYGKNPELFYFIPIEEILAKVDQ